MIMSQLPFMKQEEKDEFLIAALERAYPDHDIMKIIRAGANVNARDAQGVPALVHTVRVANAIVLGEVLARGGDADIKATDAQGRAVLHIAAMQNNIAKVKMLIAAGADPLYTGKLAQYPVDLAGKDARPLVSLRHYETISKRNTQRIHSIAQQRRRKKGPKGP